MYHTTGLTKADIRELAVMAHQAFPDLPASAAPPILGLFKCVAVTLAYLRRNRAQCELAEAFGVSQSTISRAITGMTPVLVTILDDYVPVADDLDPLTHYVVDGTLLPCWSWTDHQDLYSGKHKTTGLNVQVACTLSGRLAWISDPLPGSRHDAYCIETAAFVTPPVPPFARHDPIGDKGYIGKDMITPIRKPQYRDLLDWEKEFNTQVNRVRYVIERAIAHLKTWRILHTDYRRPLATFPETIAAVISLHFYRAA